MRLNKTQGLVKEPKNFSAPNLEDEMQHFPAKY